MITLVIILNILYCKYIKTILKTILKYSKTIIILKTILKLLT